ncbi:MAG TPA: hypothetical protein VHR88_02860 [Solirubrobacteraceae bacterium]|jgi:hypothetical protein|nr:hypothetical protein [Solirubrobacteraceae bacterium]
MPLTVDPAGPDSLGFYQATVPAPSSGAFRAVWTGETEGPFGLASREVPVSS